MTYYKNANYVGLFPVYVNKLLIRDSKGWKNYPG